MEKRSRHYGDVQKWIEKVIDSCETYDQARSARRLVWNFEKQMSKNKVDSSTYFYIGGYLTNLAHDKLDEMLKKRLG